jgi:hypothetical protein
MDPTVGVKRAAGDCASAVFASPLEAYADAFARGGFSTLTEMIGGMLGASGPDSHSHTTPAFSRILRTMEPAHATELRARVEAASSRATEAFLGELESILCTETLDDEAEGAEGAETESESEAEAEAVGEAVAAVGGASAMAGCHVSDVASAMAAELDGLKALARRLAASELEVASIEASAVPFARPSALVLTGMRREAGGSDGRAGRARRAQARVHAQAREPKPQPRPLGRAHGANPARNRSVKARLMSY